ncbi:UNVERIFIED_CONTAM: hypothetical protein PYX00_011851 [Menopon gallinae]|uniref:Uncharacterized protein n=1 Tax=Menopon gallinae TaxID=328185 RepID=A0AAW2H8Q5_9NEOP
MVCGVDYKGSVCYIDTGLQMYSDGLSALFRTVDEDVVVLCYFNAQVSYLRQITKNVVETVDRYQGSEADRVIVVFDPVTDCSVMRSRERLNVALTRAPTEMALCGAYEEGCFIVAEKQLRGRGRANTTWVGSEGCLMFSYVMHEKQQMLNVLENIRRALGVFEVNAEVKWPNDVLLSDRKICGAIIDRHEGFDVVGIGLNLFGEMGYSTVEAFTGIRICKDDFLATYGKLYREKNRVDLGISSLWFGNKACKVKEVLDDCLVLESRQGERIRISAQDYSYIKKLNRVVRK